MKPRVRLVRKLRQVALSPVERAFWAFPYPYGERHRREQEWSSRHPRNGVFFVLPPTRSARAKKRRTARHLREFRSMARFVVGWAKR